MLPHEHAAAARESLAASDAEFAADDLVRASAKLWSAASHAVMAVARDRGWSCCPSHRSLKTAVVRLSSELGDPLIAAHLGAAEKFLRNLYPDDMEDWERDADRPHVHAFVKRTLALLKPNGASEA